VKRAFQNAFPLLVVLGVLFVLGYPFAFLLSYPLAKTNLENRDRWSQTTFEALPPLDLSQPATLRFSGDVDLEQGLLVQEQAPLQLPYSIVDNVVQFRSVKESARAFTLEDLEGAVDGTNRVFRAAEEGAGRPLYLNGRLLVAGHETPPEKPDGQRVRFSFSTTEGVFAMRGHLLNPETDYTVEAGSLVLKKPAPLWLSLRTEPDWARPMRLSGEYAWADERTVVLERAPAPGSTLQLARSIVRWAERLNGAVDGANRTFSLLHDKLVPSDTQRRVYVDGRLLSAQGRPPREASDGTRLAFTFPAAGGVITLNGRLLQRGKEYTQKGAVVTLSKTPAAHSQLVQRDYAIVDADQSRLVLATAPVPPSVVWAGRYTVYDRPKCGNSVFACFLSLPQHPAPLPHWIFTKAPAFLTRFPWASDRNVLRQIVYTARGTFVALLAGGAVGLLLAALFVLVRPLERALLPWVIASQTVPIIALVPMLVLILANFGIRIQTSIVPTAIIGGYLSFFPVTIGAAKGLRSVEPLALDLMRSYAANKGQVFFKLRLYAALPFIFASFKVGAAASLVGALISETETSNAKGLGFAILGQVQAGNVADLWILFFISSLLGIVFVSGVGWAEKFLAPWVHKA